MKKVVKCSKEDDEILGSRGVPASSPPPPPPPPPDMLICGKMAQLFEYYLKYSIQDYISEFEIDSTVQKIIFL